MQILAIETSCDETSVSIVKDGNTVLSCITASSIALHKETGGIIPENAARKQIEYMIPTLEEALIKAFPDVDIKNREQVFQKIDAVAVTVGPGLIGSLLVGVETAKTLAMLFNKPIVPVNHIKAHIYAAWLNDDVPEFPLISLVISGGHTDFVYMKDHGEYEWIGGTRDDAAGECFDKCARLLGLPYPGGPSIAKAAKEFREKNANKKLSFFPRPMIHEDNFDVSFSGLKTSVSSYLKQKGELTKDDVNELSAEIEQAICDTLSAKSMKILSKYNPKSFVVCGGVSANEHVKSTLIWALQYTKQSTHLHVPRLTYSTDNAAMIGAYANFNFSPINWENVTPNPELHF